MSAVTTGAGSVIAVHEVGEGPSSVFAIGGMSVTSFVDSPVRLALEDAANKGARCTMMDIAGSGASTSSPGLVMDTWIRDVEEVFERHVRAPAIWTGASIGAWLMVIVHLRHPGWFHSMCALAPAFDWDQRYVGPRLRDGRLAVLDNFVVNPDATAVASRELLISMAPHHVLRAPVRLAAPMHVIFGGADEMAPPDATRGFIERVEGRCTGELIPAEDHGLAKLASPLAFSRYVRWLHAQLDAMSRRGFG
ncbi:MAG TPA: alpha/beta hydrolase [Usitatibacter sp.]|nr:alpha/beta hydrolase [Usitatibacter sp.]